MTADRPAVSTQVTDALLNYDTIKYFCNEAFELRNYAAAIERYQRAEWRMLVALNALIAVQVELSQKNFNPHHHISNPAYASPPRDLWHD